MSGKKPNKTKKFVGFKAESHARNVHLGTDTSENVLNEYKVPTKRNRGAYTMHNSRFNASDPQSSLVRLQRMTETYNWSPELSYADTYTRTEGIDNARRNLAYMKEEYGNNYVNAYVRRDDAAAEWHKKINEMKQRYEGLLRELDIAYSREYTVTPHELNQRESRQLGQLEDALRREIIKRSEFDEKIAKIKSLTMERRKTIVPAYSRLEAEKNELLRKWGVERAAADRSYQDAIGVGRTLWRTPAVRRTFTNKMREATRRRMIAQMEMEPVNNGSVNTAKFGVGGRRQKTIKMKRNRQ